MLFGLLYQCIVGFGCLIYFALDFHFCTIKCFVFCVVAIILVRWNSVKSRVFAYIRHGRHLLHLLRDCADCPAGARISVHKPRLTGVLRIWSSGPRCWNQNPFSAQGFVFFVNSGSSTWPHLWCDVGVEEGEYRENCLCATVLCTVAHRHHRVVVEDRSVAPVWPRWMAARHRSV